jgi:hypothetical protein
VTQHAQIHGFRIRLGLLGAPFVRHSATGEANASG